MACGLLNLLLMAVMTRGAASFTCPKVSVQSLVVDPDDCRQYYHCLPDGRVFPMQCPKGLVFDARQKVCIWDSNARSCAPDHELQPIKSQHQESSTTNTNNNRAKATKGRNSNNSQRSYNKPPTNPNPTRNDRPKPVPKRRSRNDFRFKTKRKNVNSAPISGKITSLYAPAVTMATQTMTSAESPMAKKNNMMHKVNTDERLLGSRRADDNNGRQTTTQREMSGIFAWGQQRRKRSPEDNTIEDSVYCPTGYAYIPDPTSCTAFYHCYNWQPMRKQCPPGLFFDLQTHVCNWQHNVDCLDGDRRKAAFKFDEMRKTYKNSPRGVMSVKTTASPKKTTKNKKRVSLKKKAARKVATTAATTVMPKTPKPTSAIKITTTYGRVSTSTSATTSQHFKHRDYTVSKYSSPLPKSQTGVDATQKLLAPTSTLHPTSSSSTSSSSITRTLSTLPEKVNDQNRKVPDTVYQSIENLKPAPKQKQTTTKKPITEEPSLFSTPKSNKSATRPIVLSSSSEKPIASKMSLTTTTNTPQSLDTNGPSNNSVKRKKDSQENRASNGPVSSMKDTTDSKITPLGSRKDTSTQNRKPALLKTKLSSESQGTFTKAVNNKPKMMENYKRTNNNPTQMVTRHDQTQETTTSVNSHSFVSSSPSQDKSETSSTEQNRESSTLPSSSTVIPIDAFKSELETASPMNKPKIRSLERTAALVKKNQAALKTLSMTRIPLNALRNLRVQPITWMNERRVPMPYISDQQGGDHSDSTQKHTTNNAFSPSFFPASLSYTPSTLLFRKLVIADYGDSPEDVQIDKFMANLLDELVTPKHMESLGDKHDHRSENVTNHNETKVQSTSTQSIKTENLETTEQEKKKNQTSLPGDLEEKKEFTTAKNNVNMTVSGTVMDNKTASTSIPTKAANETFKTQKITTMESSTPLFSTSQPVNDSSDDKAPVKIDTYNVKLLDKSKKEENQSSQVPQPSKNNRTHSEVEGSGQDTVHNEDDSSEETGSDQHLTKLQTLSVQAGPKQPDEDQTAPDSSSNLTAVVESQTEAQKENLQPLLAHKTSENAEEEKTENENRTETSKSSSITPQYSTTFKFMNESAGTPLKNMIDKTKSTNLTRTANGKTMVKNQQTSNCTTAKCTTNQTQGNTSRIALNSSQFSTETMANKSATTSTTTVIKSTSKTGQSVNSTSKTETESGSSFTKEILTKTDNVSFSEQTAQIFQNATEQNATVLQSNSTIADENDENLQVEPSLFLSVSHMAESSESSQTDVDEDISIHDGGKPEQKPQHNEETANTTKYENIIDQSSNSGQIAPAADKGTSTIPSSTTLGPKTESQSNDLSHPSVSNIDLNATSETKKNQTLADPEVINEKKSSVAASKNNNETSNITISTLVISVGFEKSHNQTHLKANNISTFSSIKETPFINKTGNSTALNPLPTTVLATNATDLNISLNGTTMSQGKNNSVASMKEPKQIQVSHTKQETKSVNDNLVDDVDQDESKRDSRKNALISEDLVHSDTSTVKISSTLETNSESSAKNISNLNESTSTVFTDLTNSLKTIPPPSDSLNETFMAATNETIASKSAGLNMSETQAVNGSLSEEGNITASKTKVLTTLSLDSTDSEDKRLQQQQGVNHDDLENVTNVAGQDVRENTEQSSTEKDPERTSNVKAVTNKTTDNEHTNLDASRNSTTEHKEQTGQRIGHDVTLADDNAPSKRSFVSLKDLITWYLKHWKNYSQWQRGQ